MSKDIIEQTIKNKYHIKDDKVASVRNSIIQFLTEGKEPSQNPLAIIVGGQGGSGKTALMSYTTQLSDKRDFVVIDADFFREFHPQINEIKKNHPNYYTFATDQIALEIVSDSIDYFINSDIKYNLIIQQTLKKQRIVDDAMTKLRDSGYTVGVRAFAVPYLESKMSQIERCQEQLIRFGFCRSVSEQDHLSALTGLPKTMEYIEQSGKYDFLEVYARSDDIAHPKLVYSRFNPQTKDITCKQLEDCKNVAHDDFFSDFTDVMDAIETTREQSAIKCAESLDERIADAQTKPVNDELQNHLLELQQSFESFKLLHSPTSTNSDSDQITTSSPEYLV